MNENHVFKMKYKTNLFKINGHLYEIKQINLKFTIFYVLNSFISTSNIKYTEKRQIYIKNVIFGKFDYVFCLYMQLIMFILEM